MVIISCLEAFAFYRLQSKVASSVDPAVAFASGALTTHWEHHRIRPILPKGGLVMPTVKAIATSALRLLTLGLLSSLLWGQFTSQIEGTVSDPTRSVIPTAVVYLLNVDTG